jgi:hypothetical protein
MSHFSLSELFSNEPLMKEIDRLEIIMGKDRNEFR